MLRIFYVYCFLLLLHLNGRAQGGRQYTFRHLTTANGLASNLVNGVVQDTEGYIWVASLNGLQRYDGFNFISFTHKPDDLSSLPANHIAALFHDSNRRLWVVGGNNEIGVFDTRKFRFRRAAVQGLPPQTAYTPKYLFEGADGRVYLHEQHGGIFRYEPFRNRFLPAANLLPVPEGWRINHLVWSRPQKTYWVATDSGIIKYQPFTKTIRFFGSRKELPSSGKSGDAKIFTRLSVGAGGVLVSTQSNGAVPPSFFQLDTTSGTLHPIAIEPKGAALFQLREFYRQHNGRHWVLGNPMLAEYRPAEKRFVAMASEYRNEQSISFDRGNTIFEDREANLWIGTDNGLFVFNPDAQLFTSYNLLRPNGKLLDAPVQNLLQTSEYLLVSSKGAGLFAYDLQFNPRPLPKGLEPLSGADLGAGMVNHTRSGKIWFGMQGGRFKVYDTRTGALRSISHPLLSGQNITHIAEDQSGSLWIGTLEGNLLKWGYQPGADEAKGFKLVMQTAAIQKMVVHRNDLWAATMGEGLLRIDTQKDSLIHAYRERGRKGSRLEHNHPTDIVVYNDTLLAVLAGGINLLNTNDGTIRHLGAAEGLLPSNSAVSGRKDAQGVLWIGMINGLCRVNLRQGVYTFYDRRDGICYDNFSVGSAHRLRDGRMLFATDHNFMVFDPAKLQSGIAPAKPKITGLRIGSRSLLLDSVWKEGRLTLPYNLNSLSLDFSALHFGPRGKLQYLYRMEGIDKEWKTAGENPQAVYNYLPPGRYDFRLRTENVDGLSSREFRLFPIIIRPPFWQSWWFFSVLALLLVAAIVWLDQERLRRMRAVQQTRLEIAGNLHEQLNTNLNHINILSEMARIKSGQDAEQSQRYLDQISEKSHNMIILMDDMIWSIDPNKDSLKDTLMRLEEFVAAMQSRYEALIEVAVDKKVPLLRLDMKKRHEFFVVLKEVLRLAVEQGAARALLVNINLVKGKLLVKMHDDDAPLSLSVPGVAKKLDELKSRMTSVGGELDIQVRETKLSVILVMPV